MATFYYIQYWKYAHVGELKMAEKCAYVIYEWSLRKLGISTILNKDVLKEQNWISVELAIQLVSSR